MSKVPEFEIKEAIRALLITAGLAVNVAQAEISQAAYTLARRYGTASSREIEAEIARRLRNEG